MDTDTLIAEAECVYCGKRMTRRGRGSHEKHCPQNPENAPHPEAALRVKIVRQAEEKVSGIKRIAEHVIWLLCEADPKDEPEWQGHAAEGVGKILEELLQRDALLELLAPEKGGRNGRTR